MNKISKIFVAGGTGMVSSAIIRKLLTLGFRNIISNYHLRKPDTKFLLDLNLNLALCKFVQLDLTRQLNVEKFFQKEKPEYVFLAAAKVGGILANSTYPAEFIYNNLMIQNCILHSSYLYGVKRLLFLGSSCIYPKFCPQPMKEEYLLTGELEPTNEPYAVAKIAGIRMCQSYNRQYGTNFIAVMPTNLYGPNDNFDLETSHVLPAMIRKFHEAKFKVGSRQKLVGTSEVHTPYSIVPTDAQPPVVLWGTGNPRREFLHVDDLADASVFLMNLPDKVFSPLITHHSSPGLLNIGAGKDMTIKELAALIKGLTKYKGEVIWDQTKPDGTPRKLLDVSKISALGWSPGISLEEGIKQTYHWYLSSLP